MWKEPGKRKETLSATYVNGRSNFELRSEQQKQHRLALPVLPASRISKVKDPMSHASVGEQLSHSGLVNSVDNRQATDTTWSPHGAIMMRDGWFYHPATLDPSLSHELHGVIAEISHGSRPRHMHGATRSSLDQPRHHDSSDEMWRQTAKTQTTHPVGQQQPSVPGHALPSNERLPVLHEASGGQLPPHGTVSALCLRPAEHSSCEWVTAASDTADLTGMAEDIARRKEVVMRELAALSQENLTGGTSRRQAGSSRGTRGRGSRATSGASKMSATSRTATANDASGIVSTGRMGTVSVTTRDGIVMAPPLAKCPSSASGSGRAYSGRSWQGQRQQGTESSLVASPLASPSRSTSGSEPSRSPSWASSSRALAGQNPPPPLRPGPPPPPSTPLWLPSGAARVHLSSSAMSRMGMARRPLSMAQVRTLTLALADAVLVGTRVSDTQRIHAIIVDCCQQCMVACIDAWM